jgi:hypothetical protein
MEKLCYLVLNLDLVLSRVPSASSRGARGRQHLVSLPSQPGAAVPAAHVLERTGQILQLRPALGRFPELGATQPVRRSAAKEPDEYFEYQSSYPDTDIRPEYGNPADGGGIDLPTDLPEDFSPGADMPDVGARPVDAPVMAVGVDGATQFPATGVPVAVAPPDHTIVDANDDGFELVMLDTSASYDPEGSIGT